MDQGSGIRDQGSGIRDQKKLDTICTVVKFPAQDSSMAQYLFAYGTLQPGLVPAAMSEVAAKLIPIGKGFVGGVLYDLGRYPGAVADAQSSSKIAGTVLQLPDDEDVLRRLDGYEGFDPNDPEGSDYIREKQRVELADGRSMECWFYRYNLPASPSQIIESGEWGKNSG